MRIARLLGGLALVVVIAIGVHAWLTRNPAVSGNQITVYYVRASDEHVVPWPVSLGPARDLKSIAFYAATQCVAGPPSTISDVVRFPQGTHVLSVDVAGGTATVDISKEVESLVGGGLQESAEFKALVWTMTTLPEIRAVQVLVDGRRLPTLPGGHLELDEPLSRSSW
ncbi:MAG: GerMN domain-containing protein [bacterium]|nr:GerMN domain-containing protein [bacterium]